MFAAASRFVSTHLQQTRWGPLAAAGVLAAGVAGMGGAGPWWWGPPRDRGPEHGSVRGGVRVVIGDRPGRGCELDEMPRDLRTAAYQSGDRVIVTINGQNRTSGFQTSLAGEDLCGGVVVLRLTNRAAPGWCGEAVNCFTINTSFKTRVEVSRVMLRIGARYVEIPVTQVCPLN
jgi:hypothetical protein